jgi:hypothetical protein
VSSQESKSSTKKHNSEELSFLQKVGALGALKITFTLVVFLVMTLFYTILPIAGLGLLPFLYFGCLSLIVGVCDDLGMYR